MNNNIFYSRLLVLIDIFVNKALYLFHTSAAGNLPGRWHLTPCYIILFCPQHMTAAHKDWVSALDLLRPQNVLLSGCRGGMLKLWRVENSALICK